MNEHRLPPPPQIDGWKAWREGVKNLEPEKCGVGVVTDRGLRFKTQTGKWSQVWESTTDSLDTVQLQLAAQGVTAVHRNYEVRLNGNTALPSRTVKVDATATKQRGWPIRFKIGDKVELYTWHENCYTQIAIKQEPLNSSTVTEMAVGKTV